MFSWLKRHFIPHVGNAYRPHFLMGHNIRQLLGLIVGFEIILFLLPVINFVGFVNYLNLGSVLPGVLSTLTNEERYKNNLPQLVENPVLNQAAQLKAEDMAAKGYFAHISPEGLTPWHWFDRVGYSYQYAGENLAVNFIDSKDVTEAWMNSPTHKANIVGRNYQEMGTGIAKGMYKGRETIFVAQVYGTPANNLQLAINNSPPAATNIPVAVSQEVLGETVPGIEIYSEPTFIERAVASPRQTSNAILYVILAVILCAVFLNVVIKVKNHHPDLIANGGVVAAVIFGLYLTNSYLAEKDFETSFFAFVPPETQNFPKN